MLEFLVYCLFASLILVAFVELFIFCKRDEFNERRSKLLKSIKAVIFKSKGIELLQKPLSRSSNETGSIHLVEA
ncbi:unnamed protein product, partial [Brenthis ino]